MTITPITVESALLSDLTGLDQIQVFWCNEEPGRGSVTITCWGSSWTAYFGAMPEDTIQQFFARADTGYLVTKLSITPQLKNAKRYQVYLAKIVEAVKESMKS